MVNQSRFSPGSVKGWSRDSSGSVQNYSKVGPGFVIGCSIAGLGLVQSQTEKQSGISPGPGPVRPDKLFLE